MAGGSTTRYTGRARWRRVLYRVIFEHDTPAGKAFDVLLIGAILASVGVVVLDSVAPVHARHGDLMLGAEWVFTILFTVEYVLRLLSARSTVGYARSFFGVVDLVSILPTYLSVLLPGGQYFLVVRILRLLRIFRVLKLVRFVGGEVMLLRALRASAYKIIVFLFAVGTTVVIVGALMHLIEGPESGFTSIPRAIYWAIVTLTTVGYGDIAPQTPLGQFLASLVMIMGYGIIAVPTGIVTVEMANLRGAGGLTGERRGEGEEGTALLARALGADAGPEDLDLAVGSPVVEGPRECEGCGASPHDPDAVHCKYCGRRLPPGPLEPEGG